jgi:protein-tyrosine phosphatase
MSGPTFRIVCVCTGNRFRSPLAQALLASRLDDLPALVASYGTAELPAGPAFPQAVRLGAALGVDLSAHRSRPLARVDLTAADLVIGFELIHVAMAVVDAGAARDRTFTLTELARYAPLARDHGTGDPIERARRVVRGVAELRQAGPTSAPEILDPVGHPDRVYEETANQIAELVVVVAGALLI